MNEGNSGLPSSLNGCSKKSEGMVGLMLPEESLCHRRKKEREQQSLLSSSGLSESFDFVAVGTFCAMTG